MSTAPNNTSRRGFLCGALTAGAGAAAVAVVPKGVAAVAEDKALQPEQAKTHKGYRLTQHIADYYKTASL